MRLSALLLRALRRTGWLKKVRLVLPMRLSGRVVWVPVVRGTGFSHIVDHEPFMDHVLRRTVPFFPGVFLDVGVNVGQTLIKLKSVFPNMDYVGLEPNPLCVDYTRDLARRNGWDHVRLEETALAQKDGRSELLLWSGAEDDPSATLIHDFRPYRGGQRTISISCTTWRALEDRAAIGPLGVVKVDVEGSEHEVLQQLEPRLLTDRPLTIVEVLPTYAPPIVERMQRRELLNDLCQRCALDILRILHLGPSLNFEPLERFGVSTDLAQSDHLLIPRERATEVLAALRAQ
jgi:FkbM family methyltransferase